MAIILVLKHVYLLQGNNFLLKTVTVVNVALVYLVFLGASFESGYVGGFLFVVFKMHSEDSSVRNKFLTHRT